MFAFQVLDSERGLTVFMEPRNNAALEQLHTAAKLATNTLVFLPIPPDRVN